MDLNHTFDVEIRLCGAGGWELFCSQPGTEIRRVGIDAESHTEGVGWQEVGRIRAQSE